MKGPAFVVVCFLAPRGPGNVNNGLLVVLLSAALVV